MEINYRCVPFLLALYTKMGKADTLLPPMEFIEQELLCSPPVFWQRG